MAYRVALMSQVDAGQITIEMAKYQMAQRVDEYKAQDRAATAAALGELGDSLKQAGAQMQGQRPINCNSTAFGSSINTTCF
jgi:hypothetical protein